jgi:hypothetical protein
MLQEVKTGIQQPLKNIKRDLLYMLDPYEV